MLKDFDLTDRKVLITGAGRGIGKGIALAMAEAGADVGVTSLSGTTAEQVATEVQALGRHAMGWACDATRVQPVKELYEKVLFGLGGVDILINCLGDAIRGSVAPLPGVEGRVLSEEDWHTVIDINLTQAFVG